MSTFIPTTEALLTSPAGFDLQTATNVQRARCRIGDGLPLGDLRSDPDVVAMVGGQECLEALPSEHGQIPQTVVDLGPIRSCKTMMACCRAARASQAVSVEGLKVGEVPRIALVSVKLDRARVAFRQLKGLFSRPALKALVIDETADTLIIRHPSGRPIEISCVAGGRAASGFVGDWSAGVIADEAPRMVGRDDGAVTNLDDITSAIRGRLLPGAQIQLIGSPWAPSGPVYDLVQQHWGKVGTSSIAVLRSTGPQNNPSHFNPKFCERLKETDPVAYMTDVEAQFANPEQGFASPIAIRSSRREEPYELPYESGCSYAAAADPSEGGSKGNGFTLVLVKREEIKPEAGEAGLPRYKYRVCIAREWRGVRPDDCWKEIAELCKAYQLFSVDTDQYAAAANADLARRYGLKLVVRPTTAGSKLEDFTNLATQLHTGCVELSPEKQLINDLLSVKKRTTANGYTIVLPKTGDGRHCDFAPALASAVRASFKRRNRLLEAFANYQPSGDGWHNPLYPPEMIK